MGDVRGQGMMIGIELVKDKESKEPASKEILKVMDLTKDRGLLIGKGGLDGNVIRIQPPLELSTDEADKACDILHEVFTEVEKGF